MKPVWRYLSGYVVPLLMLVFLLLSNLFTRVEFFRNLLFPERVLVVSVRSPEESPSGPAFMADTSSVDSPADSLAWAAAPLGLRTGVERLRAKSYAQAESSLTSVIAADSGNSDAWYYRGVARMRSQDPRGARDDFFRATQLRPGNSRAHFNLGVLSLRGKKFPEARASFREASGSFQKPASLVNGTRASVKRPISTKFRPVVSKMSTRLSVLLMVAASLRWV